jgi:hypothetical protein
VVPSHSCLFIFLLDLSLLERAEAEENKRAAGQEAAASTHDEDEDELTWFGDRSLVPAFPRWLDEHREIRHILSKPSLE